MTTAPVTTCPHKHLKLCKSGETKFYKCDNPGCSKNFAVPEPLEIEVYYGDPQ